MCVCVYKIPLPPPPNELACPPQSGAFEESRGIGPSVEPHGPASARHRAPAALGFGHSDTRCTTLLLRRVGAPSAREDTRKNNSTERRVLCIVSATAKAAHGGGALRTALPYRIPAPSSGGWRKTRTAFRSQPPCPHHPPASGKKYICVCVKIPLTPSPNELACPPQSGAYGGKSRHKALC